MRSNRMNITALLIVVVAITGCSPNTTPETVKKGASGSNVVTVYKTQSCGCCLKWVDHLKANGFSVDVVNVTSTAPARGRLGVPPALLSCHTGTINGYWVEGHVPADLVRQLITENPDDIQGISVPGMPMGSPGMEGPNPQTYDVVALHADGTTSVYATRQGKQAVK